VHAGRGARLLVGPAAAVRARLAARPEHWPCFYALTHRNMAIALGLLGEALALSPSDRVARRLLQLADEAGVIAATQEELAGLVGVTRTTVRRTLKRLVAAGAVQTGYGTVTITRPDRLDAGGRSLQR
jgi:CRP-like cAMP-binding protein